MEGKTVYVADDDDFAANTISMLVKGLKANPKVFTDGVSLVDGYKANNSGIAFILVDIQMPKMDGFQATKEIRAFEKSKGLPPVKIYGLSGDHDAKTQAACQASGMNDLVSKPIKKDKLQSLF